MKRLMKRVAAAVVMAACLVSLSACAASQEQTKSGLPAISTQGAPIDDSMAQSLKLSAVQSLGNSVEQLVIQETLNDARGDRESAALYRGQIEVRKEMGSIKGFDLEHAAAVFLKDGSYTVTVPVYFAKGSMEYVWNQNIATQEVKAEFTRLGSREEEGKSIGALMETAGVYAAIGIGTVFVVLVFISLLIFCFKFIHKWEQAYKEAKAIPDFGPVPVKAEAGDGNGGALAEGGNLAGDPELAAVITAAIAAYEGSSGNGLVVRSIRRVRDSRRR